MQNHPAIDRSIFIPIGIGVFSAFGICLVLLIIYLNKPQAAVSVDQTVTPFKYLLLATETPFTDSEVETPTPIEISAKEPGSSTTPEEGFPIFGTARTSQVNTLVNSSTQSLTVTPADGTSVLTGLERYDDRDPRLEYEGDWTGETNVNAHEGTLVVSTTVDSEVIFTFVGQQITIGYLSESGLGSISILIDGNEFLLDQSAGNAWLSPQFDQGEHFVFIFHESGNSVNLDYIDILGAP